MRPRLLDLFCGAGGAAMGYHRAGFDVTGVDIVEQPNFPFDFIQGDALEVLASSAEIGNFDVIHASPPCQAYTAYRRYSHKVRVSSELIAPTREGLQRMGIPWVIENVETAPLFKPLLLCGTMFEPAMEIQRHRLFESNVPLNPPMWPCRHKLNGQDRFPGGRSVARTGSSKGKVRATIEIGTWDIPLAVQQRAMGIDWMTMEELSEAIPPEYTEFIGAQLPVRSLA